MWPTWPGMMRIHRLQQENDELRQRVEQLSSLLDNLPGMAYRCLNDENLTFEYASKGGHGSVRLFP